MARNSPYIHRAPTTWEGDIDALNDKTFYLVSTVGPTVFVLKEDNLTKRTFKVIIGEEQMCSCGGGRARSRLCLHILFVMVKILRVQPANPLSWQLCLLDSEVNQILSGSHIYISMDAGGSKNSHEFLKKGGGVLTNCKNKNLSKENNNNDGTDYCSNENKGCVSPKSLLDDPICPICQDDFLQEDIEQNILCHCETRCGNNFHKRCLRMYATHKRSEKKSVHCPICRAAWPSIPDIAQTEKKKSKFLMPMIKCRGCRITIRANFYRCARCDPRNPYDLCKRCFQQLGSTWLAHDAMHPFVKANICQFPPQWTVAVTPGYIDGRSSIAEIGRREFQDDDYSLLLSLDEEYPIYKHLVFALPLIDRNEKSVTKISCILCETPFVNGSSVRVLPCARHHPIHESCLTGHLIEAQSEASGVAAATCPECKNEHWLFPSLMKRKPGRSKNESKSLCASAQDKHTRSVPSSIKESENFDVTGLSLKFSSGNTNTGNLTERTKNQRHLKQQTSSKKAPIECKKTGVYTTLSSTSYDFVLQGASSSTGKKKEQ